jgi:hypothetical protein
MRAGFCKMHSEIPGSFGPFMGQSPTPPLQAQRHRRHMYNGPRPSIMSPRNAGASIARPKGVSRVRHRHSECLLGSSSTLGWLQIAWKLLQGVHVQ